MILANEWPTITFENFPVPLLLSRAVDPGNGTEVPGAPNDATSAALSELSARVSKTDRGRALGIAAWEAELVEDVPGFERHQPVRTKTVSHPATLELKKDRPCFKGRSWGFAERSLPVSFNA